MSNIMGYFRKSKNALEKGGITLKNTTEEKVRCPICKSYETRRAIAKQKVTCPLADIISALAQEPELRRFAIRTASTNYFPISKRLTRWNFPGIRIKWIAAEPSAARRRALSVG